MAWRLAKSLEVLRREVNTMAPNRSKVSDGTIGDAAHASRNSDHNPYIKDANGVGVVRALDITHDPAGGCDAHAIADRVRLLGRSGDPRIRYVISNARIASRTNNWAWRGYSGSNAHRQHAHISVVEGTAYDSTAPWGIAEQPQPKEWDEMATEAQVEAAAERGAARALAARHEAGVYVASDGQRQLLVYEHEGLAVWIRDPAKLSAIADRHGVRSTPLSPAELGALEVVG